MQPFQIAIDYKAHYSTAQGERQQGIFEKRIKDFTELKNRNRCQSRLTLTRITLNLCS